VTLSIRGWSILWGVLFVLASFGTGVYDFGRERKFDAARAACLEAYPDPVGTRVRIERLPPDLQALGEPVRRAGGTEMELGPVLGPLIVPRMLQLAAQERARCTRALERNYVNTDLAIYAVRYGAPTLICLLALVIGWARRPADDADADESMPARDAPPRTWPGPLARGRPGMRRDLPGAAGAGAAPPQATPAQPADAAPAWSAPRELLQPVPRRCRLPPRQWAMLVALAAFTALGLGHPLWVMFEKYQLAAFKSRGVAIDGVIIRLGTSHVQYTRRSYDIYGVDYAYTVGAGAGGVPPGATYRRYVELDQEQYERLKRDPRVPVIYDPAAPRDSVLAFEWAPDPGQHYGLFLEGMYALIGLLFGMFLLIMIVGYRIEKRLLMAGQAAQARILARTSTTNAKGNTSVRLTYGFVDARGKEVVATQIYEPERAAQVERCATVLFDPRDSSVNALYPLRQMRCRAVPRFL